MIPIQVGIIVFLVIILVIVYQDEYRRRIQKRKSAKLKSFWNSAQERRKSIRINTEIDVLYEVLSGNLARKQSSISRNISEGGINLALSEKLAPETIIKLQLNLPESPRPILTHGRVIWVKGISEKFSAEKEQKFFATGIKFTQLSRKDKDALSSFVQKRIKNVTEENRL